MAGRSWLAVALAALALAALGGGLALTSSADAQSPAPTIANGVSAGGVDLSGLTEAAATQRLQTALGPAFKREVVVGVAGRVFRLSPARAGSSFDAAVTARRALGVTARPDGGTTSVPLSVRHSATAVTQWVHALAGHVYAAPHDASVRITLLHIYVHRARAGHGVDETGLARQVAAALDSPTASRVLHERVLVVRPRLNANAVELRNYTVVTVDRAHFRLRLFKNRRIVASYPIAVGRAGLETPAGIYHVQEREVNPSWHVPNSSWAGSLAGRTIPPGPNDPLVARWLGLGGGVGIHGTNEPFSIGSRASHGCIRMLVRDVIRLYPRVPLGTTVYIR